VGVFAILDDSIGDLERSLSAVPGRSAGRRGFSADLFQARCREARSSRKQRGSGTLPERAKRWQLSREIGGSSSRQSEDAMRTKEGSIWASQERVLINEPIKRGKKISPLASGIKKKDTNSRNPRTRKEKTSDHVLEGFCRFRSQKD